jgi:hypothetical protein
MYPQFQQRGQDYLNQPQLATFKLFQDAFKTYLARLQTHEAMHYWQSHAAQAPNTTVAHTTFKKQMTPGHYTHDGDMRLPHVPQATQVMGEHHATLMMQLNRTNHIMEQFITIANRAMWPVLGRPLLKLLTDTASHIMIGQRQGRLVPHPNVGDSGATARWLSAAPSMGLYHEVMAIRQHKKNSPDFTQVPIAINVSHIDEMILHAYCAGHISQLPAVGGTCHPISQQYVESGYTSNVLALAFGACYANEAQMHKIECVLVELTECTVERMNITRPGESANERAEGSCSRTKKSWAMKPIAYHTLDTTHPIASLAAALPPATGTYALITMPIITPTGSLLGGSEDPSYAEFSQHTHLAPLKLDSAVLTRMQVVDVTLPADWSMLDATRDTINSSAPRALGPSAFAIDEHARVDLTGRAVLVDAQSRISAEEKIGCIMHPMVHNEEPVDWQHCESSYPVMIELAPAFSAINATWLDRSALTALAAAANWAGGSRAVELEPHVRTALRQAANTPMDLTRLYVRLWALYYSAHIASVAAEAYKPNPVGRVRHVLTNIQAYHDWAAILLATTNRAQESIYFDSNSLLAVDDVLQVLAVATSPGVTNGLLANWLWPDIPNLVLATNSRVPVLGLTGMGEAAIANTIEWLSGTTNTQRQNTDARQLVAAMAYRPNGIGLLCATSRHNKTVIPLPRLSTAPQVISALSIWHTTLDCKPTEGSHCEMTRDVLVDAAQASMEYLHCLYRAVATYTTPDWWPAAIRTAYRRNDHILNKKSHQCWAAAAYAGLIAKKLCLKNFSGAMIAVRPAKKQMLDRLMRSGNLSGLAIATWATKLAKEDPASAIFRKIEIKTELEQTPINTMMRLKLIQGNNDEHCATAALNNAGVETGFAIISRAMGTINNVCWKPLHAPVPIRPTPDADFSHIQVCPVLKFKSTEHYLAMDAKLKLGLRGTWYVETAKPVIWENSLEERATQAYPTQGPQARELPKQEEVQQPTDEAESYQSSETSETEGVDEHFEDERDTPTKMPTDQLRRLATTDEVVALALRHQLTGKNQLPTSALNKLPTWKIPTTVAEDERSLDWLKDRFQATYMPGADQATLAATNSIMRNINEQRKLNALRALTTSISAGIGEQLSAEAQGKRPIEHKVTPMIQDAVEQLKDQAATDKAQIGGSQKQPETVNATAQGSSNQQRSQPIQGSSMIMPATSASQLPEFTMSVSEQET